MRAANSMFFYANELAASSHNSLNNELATEPHTYTHTYTHTCIDRAVSASGQLPNDRQASASSSTAYRVWPAIFIISSRYTCTNVECAGCCLRVWLSLSNPSNAQISLYISSHLTAVLSAYAFSLNSATCSASLCVEHDCVRVGFFLESSVIIVICC